MSRRVLARPPAPDPIIDHLGGALPAPPAVRTWLGLSLLVAALSGVTVAATVPQVDGREVQEWAGGLWEWAGGLLSGAARIRWTFVPVIGVLTALHYLASGLGVRAAAEGVAGRRCGLWEVTAAQFAGAAANRVTTCGLGSAAVTCRYLTRRGLPAGAATAAVAATGLLRGVAKLGLCALAVLTWQEPGRALYVPDPHRLLAGRAGLVLTVGLAIGGMALLVIVVSLLRGRSRIRAALTGVGRPLGHLLRRPRYLLTSLAASAGAHLAMTLAFAVSVVAVTGAGNRAVAALPAVYLLGATAGAAIPTPAGVGSTEAALVAALAVAHVPVAQATQGVLLFRVMTFWAPVPVGVAGTRRLRRQRAL